MRRVLPILLALPLSGCVTDTTGGRILFLVLLPVAVVAGLLWAIRRTRRTGRDDPRLRGPDYDDRG